MMTITKKRIVSFVALFMATIMMCSVSASKVYAAESFMENKTEEFAIGIIDEDGNIISTRATRSTEEFKTIRETGVNGPLTYYFYVQHGCTLKFMLGAKYANGNSGTMDIYLTGGNGVDQNYSMTMDGTVRIIDCGFVTGANSAYCLVIWPNDDSTNYTAAGSIYSLDY